MDGKDKLKEQFNVIVNVVDMAIQKGGILDRKGVVIVNQCISEVSKELGFLKEKQNGQVLPLQDESKKS